MAMVLNISKSSIRLTQPNTIHIRIYIFSSQFTTHRKWEQRKNLPPFSPSQEQFHPKIPFNLSSTIRNHPQNQTSSSMPASSRRAIPVESLSRPATFNQKLPAASLPYRRHGPRPTNRQHQDGPPSSERMESTPGGVWPLAKERADELAARVSRGHVSATDPLCPRRRFQDWKQSGME